MRRGGALLAAHTPQEGQHFHLDHLGSPRMITDATGTTLAQHLYFPFGEEATSPGQDDEVLRFTGHERDFLDSTGTTRELDYMMARYFSARLGRFQSVDRLGGVAELPQSWNRYSYVLSNPVNYIDPTGEFAQAIGQGLWDYLHCLIHGGCADAVIEVVDQAPQFDPLTGVSGYYDLLSDSGFLLNISGSSPSTERSVLELQAPGPFAAHVEDVSQTEGCSVFDSAGRCLVKCSLVAFQAQ